MHICCLATTRKQATIQKPLLYNVSIKSDRQILFSEWSMWMAAHSTTEYVMPPLNNNWTAIEELWFLCGPCRYVLSRMSEWVNEWGLLGFSCWDLLLWEAGSWGGDSSGTQRKGNVNHWTPLPNNSSKDVTWLVCVCVCVCNAVIFKELNKSGHQSRTHLQSHFIKSWLHLLLLLLIHWNKY
jgi:hypothetical protein